MSDLKQRLDELREYIQKKDFLEGKGLSNEVNIQMFCYDPKEEMAVRYFIEKLTTDPTLQCHLIECNLYKIFLQICEDKRILNSIPGLEEKKGKDFILKQLARTASNKVFIEKMQYEPHEPGDVILITGVGEAFPFIRVHALLDAMQPYFSDVPILVMYPGEFDGRNMRLFGKLKPNPYYRAFNNIQEVDK